MAGRSAMLSSEGLFPQSRKPDPELIHLAMGIFTQAVRDLVSPQKKLEKDWELWQLDSQDWFASDSDHIGSFLWVCDVIDCDPRQMRKWVEGLRDLDKKSLKATILSLVRLTYLRPNRACEPAD